MTTHSMPRDLQAVAELQQRGDHAGALRRLHWLLQLAGTPADKAATLHHLTGMQLEAQGQADQAVQHYVRAVDVLRVQLLRERERAAQAQPRPAPALPFWRQASAKLALGAAA